jgi:hypothetical protein
MFKKNKKKWHKQGKVKSQALTEVIKSELIISHKKELLIIGLI